MATRRVIETFSGGKIRLNGVLITNSIDIANVKAAEAAYDAARAAAAAARETASFPPTDAERANEARLEALADAADANLNKVVNKAVSNAQNGINTAPTPPNQNTPTPAATSPTRQPTPVSPAIDPQTPARPALDPTSLRGRARANAEASRVNPTVDPAAAEAIAPAAANSPTEFKDTQGGATYAKQLATQSPLANEIQANVENARSQPAQAIILGDNSSNYDWRVRLRLGQNAGYLYNDPDPGILQPLKATNGIIFPYTPKIDISYKTSYQNYDVTHSNFRGYYYQNSQVGDIQISAKFTAQNTAEANYLLAVIHFFRSAGKMFYGQDAQRGTPPPLLFLSGLGQFQFNNHPCLLSNFTYGLPEDVDYIRAHITNQMLTNLTERNNRKEYGYSTEASASQRLADARLTKGALANMPFGSPPTVPYAALANPTYVPTKIDLSITLHPVNTREQVSKQFSLKQYANGNQLRGGFW
jgi:hypothetical protein